MACLTAGCLERDLAQITPCVVTQHEVVIPPSPESKIDLLFLIDDSNSMENEQSKLERQIPMLVDVLASGRFGDRTFPPLRDLQVGIVSSDLGAPGTQHSTCAETGDDAVLRTRTAAEEGCPAVDEGIMRFADGDDTAAFSRRVGCVARLGTAGCGMEQQLDAVLKAITPATSEHTFRDATRGHGDGANAGFVRDDALLVVLVLTDEDDCSALDGNAFYRLNSTDFPSVLNQRCARYPDALQPLDRYVRGLLSLKSSPDQLVFAVIGGVPPDVAPSGTDCRDDADCAGASRCVRREDGRGICETDYHAILSDPRMQIQFIGEETPTIGFVCRASDDAPNEGAYPARRLVETAAMIEAAGGSGVVQSICSDSFTSALESVVRRIADVLDRACLPRALGRNAIGEVSCDVVEVLRPGGEVATCEALAARVPGRDGETALVDEDGNVHCLVAQVRAPGGVLAEGSGWYYDEESEEVQRQCGARPRRIAFTPDARPLPSSLTRLSCLSPLSRGDAATASLGSICAGGEAGDRFCGGAPITGLVCDAERRTCERPCAEDVDCADLPGRACDVMLARPVCVAPTCR